MATKKSGGTVKNGRDSAPKYLGVKLFEGQRVKTGNVIIRQRGTQFAAGRGTSLGKDYTIFATRDGKISFTAKRKTNYAGQKREIKTVSVI